MFIKGTKEYLEATSSRLVETGEGPAFLVTLTNWCWEVFRFCEENDRYRDNEWHIRGAWKDAQWLSQEQGIPLGEAFNGAMTHAALLSAETELDEMGGHANTMRKPDWEADVIRRSTNGVLD